MGLLQSERVDLVHLESGKERAVVASLTQKYYTLISTVAREILRSNIRNILLKKYLLATVNCKGGTHRSKINNVGFSLV